MTHVDAPSDVTVRRRSSHIEREHDPEATAIRRLVAEGSRLDRPMPVEFVLRAPTRDAVKSMAAALRHAGYTIELDFDCDETEWRAVCATDMLLSYDAIRARRADLASLARPFGGVVEGWGSFGNAGSAECRA